jgi:hypothetical protein
MDPARKLRTARSRPEAVPGDRPVSIVQLDVEGHEKPVLQGAQGLIERRRPILILEGSRRGPFSTGCFRRSTTAPMGRLHGNVVHLTAGQERKIAGRHGPRGVVCPGSSV